MIRRCKITIAAGVLAGNMVVAEPVSAASSSFTQMMGSGKENSSMIYESLESQPTITAARVKTGKLSLEALMAFIALVLSVWDKLSRWQQYLIYTISFVLGLAVLFGKSEE